MKNMLFLSHVNIVVVVVLIIDFTGCAFNRINHFICKKANIINEIFFDKYNNKLRVKGIIFSGFGSFKQRLYASNELNIKIKENTICTIDIKYKPLNGIFGFDNT
eukprot:541668_1